MRQVRWWAAAGAAVLAGVLWWQRALVWLMAKQLFLGLVVALAALPVMKRLEKRFPPGAAAVLSVGLLNLALTAALLLVAPSVVQQARRLLALLPGLWRYAEETGARAQAWLVQRGFSGIPAGAQTALLEKGQQAVAAALPALAGAIGGLAGNVGQWLLAPVFGFYFLRDRRQISRWLLGWLPPEWRGAAVETLREMRRDTAAYLRGQLLVSAAVGGLTALALLICGIPEWLMLGAVMAVLEMIPYAGPVLGTVLTALFALPHGLWRTAGAVGALIAVQQLDGSVLSPRLISQTTRLHPAAVILCVAAGGAAGGMAGIVLAVPLVLCLRAVLRTALFYLGERKTVFRSK